jgi:hypothetical protein
MFPDPMAMLTLVFLGWMLWLIMLPLYALAVAAILLLDRLRPTDPLPPSGGKWDTVSLAARRRLVDRLERVAGLLALSGWSTLIFLVLRDDWGSLVRLLDGTSILGLVLLGPLLLLRPFVLFVEQHNPLFVVWGYIAPLAVYLLAVWLDPDPRVSIVVKDPGQPRYALRYEATLVYKGQRVWACGHAHDSNMDAEHCGKWAQRHRRRIALDST